MTTAAHAREQLLSDVKSVIGDAEALLKATAADTSERVRGLRPRLQESVDTAKRGLVDAERALRERGKAAADAADRYARDNPWRIAGIAAAVGLLVGVVIGRRD